MQSGNETKSWREVHGPPMFPPGSAPAQPVHDTESDSRWGWLGLAHETSQNLCCVMVIRQEDKHTRTSWWKCTNSHFDNGLSTLCSMATLLWISHVCFLVSQLYIRHASMSSSAVERFKCKWPLHSPPPIMFVCTHTHNCKNGSTNTEKEPPEKY